MNSPFQSEFDRSRPAMKRRSGGGHFQIKISEQRRCEHFARLIRFNNDFQLARMA
jgi:hypothetical protein